MKKYNPKLSIILRSKNEEKWIHSCLTSVFNQTYRNFEVILVDNKSTDRTVERAKQFPLTKILEIHEFYPGKALNLGINESSGDYLVCLSSHCIPINEQWLSNLLAAFTDESIAGVYGRQEPLTFTPDVDKRDLINIFGLDKKVQRKDPFFHNANSMIRKDVWEQFPFSNSTTNLEDRIWAKNVLEHGYTIVYEPEARVYHYHGINQGRNTERAKNVVQILENLHPSINGGYIPGKHSATAIIPVREPVKYIGDHTLLEISIDSVINSSYCENVIVSTDNKEHASIARQKGAKVFMRPKHLSHNYIDLDKVYQFTLENFYEEEAYPDLVFLMHEVYPLRPPDLLDNMIFQLANSDCDCLLPALPIYNSLWRSDDDEIKRLDPGFIPTLYKEPVRMGIYGLGCLINPKLVLGGSKIGHNTGLFMIDDPFCSIKINDSKKIALAKAMLPVWRQQFVTAHKA